MEILFSYDGPIYRCGEDYYTVSFTDKILNRYIILGDHLNFLVRVKEINNDQIGGYSKISNDFTTIIECKNVSSPVSLIKNIKYVSDLVKKQIEKNDVIFIRMPSFLGLICARIAHKNGKKIVVEVVTNAKETLAYHSFIGKCIAFPTNLLFKKCIYKADYVIYITKKYLQTVYPTSGKSFICSDVSIEPLDDINYKKRLCLCKKIGESYHYSIGSIGGISEKFKGHEFVIKAISLLANNGYDLDYYLIGSGDPSRLKKISIKYGVQDRVHFLGKIPHEKVFSYIDDWDIYAQPSLSEAQGRSLIEAMSRGCLCVCSDVGGMRELIPSKYRFYKGNYTDLSIVIERIINLNYSRKVDEVNKLLSLTSEFMEDSLNNNRENIYNEILCDMRDK